MMLHLKNDVLVPFLCLLVGLTLLPLNSPRSRPAAVPGHQCSARRRLDTGLCQGRVACLRCLQRRCPVLLVCQACALLRPACRLRFARVSVCPLDRWIGERICISVRLAACSRSSVVRLSHTALLIAGLRASMVPYPGD
jgi:hypothetical protein